MGNRLIIIILLIGIFYRLALTANGSFLFNMDNARDMVDVRGMVVLHKMRLIGPTSAIEGFFNGPGWYYLLAIPFILTGGDPYGSILMEIMLWAVGGFFLLKLVQGWGSWLLFPIAAIWIAADYIVLTNLYAFNPNPVLLLTPLFIYLLVKMMEEGKAAYVISVWFLGGLFFNLEMNFGVFIPLIILISLLVTQRTNLIKKRAFWIGATFFIFSLLPQVIFDFKHNFIMSESIIRFLSENHGNYNLLDRLTGIPLSFYNTFVPTLLNRKNLVLISLLCSIPVIIRFLKSKGKKDLVAMAAMVYIIVPFLGYLILPVTVNPWHLGGPMAASVILIAFVLKELLGFSIFGKMLSVSLTFFIVLFGTTNFLKFFISDRWKPSLDPSLLKNEITAIDYVYKKANGLNFKVYTYLPSVYDYPYQYLFWWYGQKKFGYLPTEYEYAPNKPPYFVGKAAFSATGEQIKQRQDSNLVFLIKEPDRNDTRAGWEGDFVKLKSLSKEMVGLLEIEIRQDISQ